MVLEPIRPHLAAPIVTPKNKLSGHGYPRGHHFAHALTTTMNTDRIDLRFSGTDKSSGNSGSDDIGSQGQPKLDDDPNGIKPADSNQLIEIHPPAAPEQEAQLKAAAQLVTGIVPPLMANNSTLALQVFASLLWANGEELIQSIAKTAPDFGTFQELARTISTPDYSLILKPFEDENKRIILRYLLSLKLYGLKEGEHIVVGRGKESDVFRVNYNQISRRHAQFKKEAGQITVTDLGSRNGTNFDGQSLPENEATPVNTSGLVHMPGIKVFIEPSLLDPKLFEAYQSKLEEQPLIDIHDRPTQDS